MAWASWAAPAPCAAGRGRSRRPAPRLSWGRPGGVGRAWLRTRAQASRRGQTILDIAVTAPLCPLLFQFQGIATGRDGQRGIIWDKAGFNSRLFQIPAACPHLSAHRAALHAFLRHIHGQRRIIVFVYLLNVHNIAVGPKAAYQDSCDRNAVEDTFGTGKRPSPAATMSRPPR